MYQSTNKPSRRGCCYRSRQTPSSQQADLGLALDNCKCYILIMHRFTIARRCELVRETPSNSAAPLVEHVTKRTSDVS